MQESLWLMVNNDVHGGLVPTRDDERLTVRSAGSAYSAFLAFNMFALVVVN